METGNLNQSVRSVSNLLRATFGILPIAAGADKFTNILTNWEQYLNPGIEKIVPLSPHNFMMIVGVIEIIAGILVLVKPVVGAVIVAAWLTAIAITLLAGGQFLDVAVRDLVMAISAFSLFRLSKLNIAKP